MEKGKCATCQHNRGYLHLDGEKGVSCGSKGVFVRHPGEALECEDYMKAYRRQSFNVTDNDLYNAATSWLLDTDADSFAEVIGPAFGVKIEVAEDHTRKGGGIIFRCLPVGQQYMDGLKDIMIEEDD